MRIAFYHNLPIGGAQRALKEQAEYLSKNNVVDIYELKNNEHTGLFNPSISGKIYKYNFPYTDKNLFLSRLSNDISVFTQLPKLHKKIASDINSRDYDFVIAHPDSYTQAPFILRFLKKPHAYYCEEWLRGVYEDEFSFQENVIFYKKWYEHIIRSIRKKIDYTNVQFAHLVFANSIFTKENIKKAYKKDAHVMYLGVNPSIFKPLKKKDKKYDVLFLGEKNEIEGYPLLQKAKKYIKYINILETSFRENKKWISDTKLCELYNLSRIVVCLSLNEPFGLIPLEAMACGVPVIAVNHGGYRETVIHNKTGLLINSSPQALAKAISILLNNTSKRNTFGKNGRVYICNNWTWSKRNKYLYTFIKQCIREN